MDASGQGSSLPLQQDSVEATMHGFADVHCHLRHMLQASSAMAVRLGCVQTPCLSSLLMWLLLRACSVGI